MTGPTNLNPKCGGEELGDEATDTTQRVALSRLLSKVLRHEPALVGVQLDAEGWVSINDLIVAINKSARSSGAPKRVRTLGPISREELLAVVAFNDKQRFTLSANGQRIRAVQGHSIKVDLGYPPIEPPTILYHGTAYTSWAKIRLEGLHPGSRHAVHLSSDSRTAKTVGARHGRPVVLEVAAAQMHADGYRFARADNGVWLVSDVPPRYIRGPK